MEVILRSKIDNLGNLGDKVKVRSGYGRNFLIPQGKAVPVTAANLAEFERRRADLETDAQNILKTAEERREQLDGRRFEISRRAGAEGKLFGSVGSADIAEVLTQAGSPVERREVRMPDDSPIHELGEFEIQLHLHLDINARVIIAILPEE